MKKTIALLLFTSILLAGCGGNTESSTDSTQTVETNQSSKLSSSTSTQSTASSTSKSKETSESTFAATSETKDTTKSSANEAANTNAYPYQTELPGVTVFRFHGMNVPDSVTVDPAQGNVTINNGSSASSYSMSIQNVPTREIRIFSAGNNQIRTVSVNTALQIGGRLSGDGQRDFGNDTFYLFRNSNGGLSLVTPNYAGNVMPEDTDVMQEVLQ